MERIQQLKLLQKPVSQKAKPGRHVCRAKRTMFMLECCMLGMTCIAHSCFLPQSLLCTDREVHSES